MIPSNSSGQPPLAVRCNGSDKKPCYPSAFPVQWAESSTKKCHFPAFATAPQQDVDHKLNRVRMLPVIDEREQPWLQIVLANIHEFKPNQVPARSASVKEVKEWLYFVLTECKWATTIGAKPAVVTATLQMADIDGEKLRTMNSAESWYICPSRYINVDDETVRINVSDRNAVHHALHTTILPLLKANRKLEKKIKKKEQKERKWDEKALMKVSVAMQNGHSELTQFLG